MTRDKRIRNAEKSDKMNNMNVLLSYSNSQLLLVTESKNKILAVYVVEIIG